MQGIRFYSNDIVGEFEVSGISMSLSNSSSSLSMDLDESTETRIQRLISEHPVIIFTRSSCCMCHVMKKLLATIGVHPTVIELEDNEIAALPLPDTTAPAAFIGGSCIGGLESLVALHVTGHLIPKLVQVGALWIGGDTCTGMVSMTIATKWNDRVRRLGPIDNYEAIRTVDKGIVTLLRES